MGVLAGQCPGAPKGAEAQDINDKILGFGWAMMHNFCYLGLLDYCLILNIWVDGWRELMLLDCDSVDCGALSSPCPWATYGGSCYSPGWYSSSESQLLARSRVAILMCIFPTSVLNVIVGFGTPLCHDLSPNFIQGSN